MHTVCPDCGTSYDDTYRWTICPHDSVAMRTLAVRTNADGTTDQRVCTSVDELKRFMARRD